MIVSAVIGLGVGLKHLETLHKNNIQIKYICDYKKTFKKLEKEYNTKYIDDLNKIILDDEVNLVVIASYDDSHFIHLKKCLLKNKNVFIEKPLCTKKSQIISLKNILKYSKSNIKINYVLRENPIFINLKKKIKSKFFGKIYNIEASYNYGRFNKIKNGWRNNKNYDVSVGGGIHMIDLINWLVGGNISKRFKINKKIKHKYLYDFKQLNYQLSKDINVNIFSNFCSKTPHDHELKIFGTNGFFYYGYDRYFYTNKDDSSFNKNKETFIDKKYYSLNNDYKKTVLEKFIIQLSTSGHDKSYIRDQISLYNSILD